VTALEPVSESFLTDPLSLRVLVVDDVPIQRKMLARRLTDAGYTVDTASSGEEALEKVLAGAFDFLITDRDMPGMDGATLCRQIREIDLPAGYLFIIMLTGRDSVPDFVSGLRSGADIYIRKSSDPLELLACMNTGIRIVRLERELRKAKATDGLLDVYRRDYLGDNLPREIERARRYNTPLSLVMMDLDRFKRINDEYNHLVGDEVLRGFCSRARTFLRPFDWLARYGGEEFALVLPHADLSRAESIAQRIRAACETPGFATSAGPLNVTVSLGVAELRADANALSSATELLRRADEALLYSKRTGRNRVTCEGSYANAVH
jgi:two-component system, cell cycle response regulator